MPRVINFLYKFFLPIIHGECKSWQLDCYKKNKSLDAGTKRLQGHIGIYFKKISRYVHNTNYLNIFVLGLTYFLNLWWLLPSIRFGIFYQWCKNMIRADKSELMFLFLHHITKSYPKICVMVLFTKKPS